MLLSKNFQGGQQSSCYLDLDALPVQMSPEQKLSRLCAWVLQAQQQHSKFGCKLGPQQFPSDSGLAHQHACLYAMALYKPGKS